MKLKFDWKVLFLLVAFVSFALGIYLPIFTLNKLWVFEESFSIIGGVITLLEASEYLLGIFLLAFSIVMPILKMLFLLLAILTQNDRAKQKKYVTILVKIGKWSMADVFVIAIIASTIKFSGLATVDVHEGLIFFSMSVALSLLITHAILRHYELVYKGETKVEPSAKAEIAASDESLENSLR